MSLALIPANCYAQAPIAARPILFVHGICDTADSWQPLYSQLRSYLTTSSSLDSRIQAQYIQDPNGTLPQRVYFDGVTVRTWPDGQPLASVGSPNTRFFAINLFDGHSSGQAAFQQINSGHVANVSILNKGDEIAQVLRAITELTNITDVIVIAHSMGGLDARAYMQGLAVPLQSRCNDDGSGTNETGTYTSCQSLGRTPFSDDVAQLITLDTPHSGAIAANIAAFAANLFPKLKDASACHSPGNLNVRELPEPSYVVKTLLNDISSIPPGPAITAIRSYTQPGLFYLLDGSIGDDGAVTQLEQSIADISSRFIDIKNAFDEGDIRQTCGWLLHHLSCVGAEAQTWHVVNGLLSNQALAGSYSSVTVTSSSHNLKFALFGPVSVYDGVAVPQTFWDVPPGTYQIRDVTGGPNANPLSTSVTVGPGNWNPTITISFGAPSPSVKTVPAAGVAAGTPTLQGSVNPNGAAGSAWFLWGPDPALTNPQTTQSSPAQSIGAGSASVPLQFALPDIEPGATIYFRAVASDIGGGLVPGGILSLTTLAAMPAPSLQIPTGGESGVSVTPTLSWTAVPNATSYRLFVASDPAALPRDPIEKVCIAPGCVWYDTPTGSSYSVEPGVLAAFTTYYWTVHARSPAQFGYWSSIASFKTGSAPPTSDFALQISPSMQTAYPNGSTSFLVSTTATGGAPESITFTTNNLPTGVTGASFSPPYVTAGSSSTLTLTMGATPGSGSFDVVGVAATGNHSVQANLDVLQTASSPAVTLMPQTQIFPDQMVGTASATQTTAFRNSGGSPLIVTAISIAAGGDYGYILPQNTTFPLTPLNPGGQFVFQVYFQPTTTGARSGTIYVWDNAPDSPQAFSFTGNGLPALPTAGLIQINGTLNGIPLPNTNQFSYPFTYTLNGPSPYTGGGAETLNVTPGTYTLSFNICCALTLSSITPSATQQVSAGGAITFTMNFTAPNDFYPPYFGFPVGSSTTQIVPAGATATFYPRFGYPNGNPSSPITLQVLGIPADLTPAFVPQPSYGSSTLTVATNPTTPPGMYTITLTGTNSTGLSHSCCTATLAVTAPPTERVQQVSLSSSGVQGNGASWAFNPGGVSADGRYVVYQSQATNLTANDSVGGIFVRDTQAGTTTLASIDESGASLQYTYQTAISANGQFVTFSAWNGTVNAIYLRDLQAGFTERDDVAMDGTPGNADAHLGGISADGRFVAFSSVATNLVQGVVSGVSQCYVRDRNISTTHLVSTATDGRPGNQACLAQSISADGRYVTFISAATNLVSVSVNAQELFFRDMQSGQTTLASVATNGTAANSSVNSIYGPSAISADGRFVVFTSSATNLVPQSTNDDAFHLYLRDTELQQTSLLDTDATGNPLGGGSQENAVWPSISADGRFIAFEVFGQVFIRDTTTNDSRALSVAADGTIGNADAVSPAISPGATIIAFGSSASNFVSGDTNNVSDAFVAGNPFLAADYIALLSVSPASVSGGSTVQGNVVLNTPAPAGGVNVTLSSNNVAIQLPATAYVPEGATTGIFAVSTSLVASETRGTIIGSYGGGSAISVLTLEPGAAISVVPAEWDFGGQAVGTASTPQTFVLTNSGTAPATFNSIALSSSQNFQVSSNCPAGLAVGASCTVSISFRPLQPGAAVTNALQVSFAGGSGTATQSIPIQGFSPASCVASLSAASANLSSVAASGTVDLFTTDGCVWTATNAASWLVVTSSASGSGNGSISFLAAANSSVNSRTGTLTIEGQTFTVTQAGIGLATPSAGIYDDRDQSITYNGSWNSNVADGRYNRTQTFSNVAGSTASFTFTGTQVTYLYEAQGNMGHAQVSIDGSVVTPDIDEFAATGQAQQRLTYGGLSNETHTITVTAFGTSDAQSAGAYVIIDAFIVGPAPAGTYDDRNPQIIYSGTWGSNTADGRYDGTQTFSNVAQSTASFTFTGTQVTYLYEAQWNMGHAQVSIDGNIVTPDVDEFAPAGQAQQRLTYGGLAHGMHTITVTALGTSDSQSTGAYVIIDAFIVGPVGPGTYDDRDPQIIYGGSWGSNLASGRYNGTQTFSNTAGSAASFTFTGTQVTYLYEAQSNMGHAQVTIDGSVVTPDVDEFAATGQQQQKLTYSGLTNTTHTITVTALGTSDAQAVGAYVIIDAFIVGPALTGMYDDRDPQIVYTGSWGSNTADGRYDGTQSFSNVAGSTTTFTFTGTQVTYLYEAQSNMGHAQVSIDGNVVTPDIDEFAAVGQQQQKLTYGGLTNGTHTITVSALGTSDAQSAGAYVIVDAFLVGPAPAGIYDDGDPQVVYSGSWGSNTASGRYNGTQSFSNVAGSSATFTFTGTQVTYLYEAQQNMGHAQVSIDGNVVTSDVDEFAAVGQNEQKLTYSGLSDGAHTITVTALGNSDAQSAGSYVIVDAFIVGPAPAGAYDDGDPQVVYNGNWNSNTAPGRYNGTQSFSNAAGSTASFTFSGTQISYLYEAQANMGHAQVSIDGVILTPDVDEFAAVGQQQQTLTYSGLGMGVHTITVTALGTKDPQSTNAYVIIDAFLVEQ